MAEDFWAIEPEPQVTEDQPDGAIQINYTSPEDEERRRRRALALEHLQRLTAPASADPTTGSRMEGQQAIPEPQGLATQAEAVAGGVGLSLAPALAGVVGGALGAAGGTAAGAAATVNPVGAAAGGVAGAMAGGGTAAVGVGWAQNKILSALAPGMYEHVKKAMETYPELALLGEYGVQAATFRPGRQKAVAGAVSKVWSGKALTKVETAAVKAVAKNAAISSGSGTGTQVAIGIATGHPLTGRQIVESMVMNGLGTEPGIIGRAGMRAGASLTPRVGASPTADTGTGRIDIPPIPEGMPGGPEAATAVAEPPPVEAPTAAPEPVTAVPQAPLQEHWGARPGQVHRHFVDLGYDAKAAIVEATKGPYTPEPYEATVIKANEIIRITGSNPEEILGTDIGRSAAAIDALNQLVVRKAADVEVAMGALANATDPSPQMKAHAIRAMAELRAVAQAADRGRSEIGRALGINNRNMDAKGALRHLDAVEAAAMKAQTSRSAAAKKKGQAEYLKAMAKIDADGLKEVADLYQKIPKEKQAEFGRRALFEPRSKLYELWVSGLMGPGTFVVNAAGDAMLATAEMGALAGAVGVGRIHSPKKGGEVTATEVATRLRTARQAAFGGPIHKFPRLLAKMVVAGEEGPLALRVAMETWKNEGDWQFGTQSDKYGTGRLPAIPGKTGKAFRSVLRGMKAVDAGFKAMQFVAAVDGLAVREAVKQGKSIPEHIEAVRADVTSEKPKLMFKRGDQQVRYYDAAKHEAVRNTLEEPSYVAHKMAEVTRDHPMLDYMQPFKLIPVNIAKTANRWSPVPVARYGLQRAGLMKTEGTRSNAQGKPEFQQYGELNQAIAKGGAERDTALARIGLGSAMMGGIFYAAWNGHVTGDGPVSKAERNLLYHYGWLPNAARADDAYYSYSRFNPISTLVSTAATWAEVLQDRERGKLGEGLTGWGNAAARMSMSMAQHIAAAPFMGGTASVLDALLSRDPLSIRTALRTADNFAASWIPAIVGDIAKAADPQQRASWRGAGDAIKAKLPGVRTGGIPSLGIEGLSPRRDVVTGKPVDDRWLGDEVVQKGLARLTGVQKGLVSQFPLSQEAERIGFAVGTPHDYIDVGKERITFTDAEYDKFLMRSGQQFFRDATAKIHSSAYLGKNVVEKDKMLHRVLDSARDSALDELMKTTRIRGLVTAAERKAKLIPR